MNKSTYKSHIGKVFHLGRYICTVEDVIAEGGFAIVFRVRAQTGEVFALKRMYVNNEQDLKVCKREIQIVSSLTHKNIIRYIDSSITLLSDGVYEVFLLLEYCRRTVMQLLLERQNSGTGLTESEVMRIFCDMLEAVARLHHCTTPVIHRDLKVENILIDDRGAYVLCDFGSATAKVLEPARIGAARCEEELARYTTLAYRAPEMVDVYSGRPITTKADIWALGCLLFYLAFFQLPFSDSTLAIQSGRFTFPASAVRSYSPALLALIRYCLQTDPDQRPDIHQVAACAFAAVSRPNPVINLHRSVTLTVEQLIATYLDSDRSNPQASASRTPATERDSRTLAHKKDADRTDGRSTSSQTARAGDARSSEARAHSAAPSGHAVGGNGAARPRPHAATASANGAPLLALPPRTNATTNVSAQKQSDDSVASHRRKGSESGSQQEAEPPATWQTSSASALAPIASTAASSGVDSAQEQLSGLSFSADADFGAEFDKLREQPEPQTHLRTASQPIGSQSTTVTHAQTAGQSQRHASGGALPSGKQTRSSKHAATQSRPSANAAASGGQVFEYRM